MAIKWNKDHFLLRTDTTWLLCLPTEHTNVKLPSFPKSIWFRPNLASLSHFCQHEPKPIIVSLTPLTPVISHAGCSPFYKEYHTSSVQIKHVGSGARCLKEAQADCVGEQLPASAQCVGTMVPQNCMPWGTWWTCIKYKGKHSQDKDKTTAANPLLLSSFCSSLLHCQREQEKKFK